MAAATTTTTVSSSNAVASASVSVAASAATASPSAALINTATVTGSCSGSGGEGHGRGRGSSFRDICAPSIDPDDYPIFTLGQEEDEVSSAERKQPMMEDEASRKLGISEQARTPSMLQSRRRLPAATSSSFSTRFLTNNATPLYSNVTTAAATPISKAAKATPAVVSLADLHDMISKDHSNKSHSSSGNLLKSWFSSLTRKTSGNSSSKSKNSCNNSSSDTKWQNLHNSSNNSSTITSNTTNAAAAAAAAGDLRMMMMMEEDEWNLSLEGLKQKLLHASVKRDVALTEVRQLKSSMRGLEEKLKRLEFYCDTLKHALSRSVADEHTHKMRTNHNHNHGHHHQEEYNKMMRNFGHEQHFYPANFSNLKPLTLDAMVETFLESIAEARSAVRQLCRMFVVLLQEDASGRGLDKLNHVLQPFHLEYGSVESNKISRTALYHVEALFNQVLYQDFENCSFENNGSQAILDPYASCTANFASFNSVRNLAWHEVLSKGSTKYFNESFSRFCDQKMALIVAMLGLNVNSANNGNNNSSNNNNSNCSSSHGCNNNNSTATCTWPEHVLHAFFVAAKTLWLLHLCAFSFHPPLSIFRVQCGSTLDPLYMDDMLADRSNLNANNTITNNKNKNKGNINATTVTNLKSAAATVRIMVMPGFYIHNNVVKCKVLCRYNNNII